MAARSTITRLTAPARSLLASAAMLVLGTGWPAAALAEETDSLTEGGERPDTRAGQEGAAPPACPPHGPGPFLPAVGGSVSSARVAAGQPVPSTSIAAEAIRLRAGAVSLMMLLRAAMMSSCVRLINSFLQS